jgi:hypothetical protein
MRGERETNMIILPHSDPFVRSSLVQTIPSPRITGSRWGILDACFCYVFGIVGVFLVGVILHVVEWWRGTVRTSAEICHMG